MVTCSVCILRVAHCMAKMESVLMPAWKPLLTAVALRVLQGPGISGIGLNWPLVLLDGVYPVGFLAPVWPPCRLICRFCLGSMSPRWLRLSHHGWECRVGLVHPGMRWECQVIRQVLGQVSGQLIGQVRGHPASGMLLRSCLPHGCIRRRSLRMTMLTARACPGRLLARQLALPGYMCGAMPAMQIVVQVLVPVSMHRMLPCSVRSCISVSALWKTWTATDGPQSWLWLTR